MLIRIETIPGGSEYLQMQCTLSHIVTLSQYLVCIGFPRCYLIVHPPLRTQKRPNPLHSSQMGLILLPRPFSSRAIVSSPYALPQPVFGQEWLLFLCKTLSTKFCIRGTSYQSVHLAPIPKPYFAPFFFTRRRFFFTSSALRAFAFRHAINRSPGSYARTLTLAFSAARPICQFVSRYM